MPAVAVVHAAVSSGALHHDALVLADHESLASEGRSKVVNPESTQSSETWVMESEFLCFL